MLESSKVAATHASETVDYDCVINDLATVRDFLRWSVSRFYEANVCFGQGSDDPWDDASALILYALHLPWDIDPRVLDSRLTRQEKIKIVDLIRARVDSHQPTAYLIKSAHFAGLEFYVDERVLIPRSPVAELIQQQFAPWVKADQLNRVLDLCTGSGCIGIATAIALPHITVDCVDISAKALQVAQINIDQYDLGQRVRALESDLFEALDGTYDLIVSNPPYVSSAEVADLPLEFLREPAKLALESGIDGLDCVRKMLSQARTYLSDEGVLVVEVGYSQPALQERFPEVPFLWLEFEHGGQGVLVLTAQQLDEFAVLLKF